MSASQPLETPAPPRGFSRRQMFVGGGLAAAGVLAVGWWRRASRPRASVFIARGQRYDGDLTRVVRQGLLETGVDPPALRGKRVLLKPNLVEPTRAAPHLTTHPAVVLAAANVFLGWGAEVAVGEGPGHVRDTEMALVESGVSEALDSLRLPFVDLNYEEADFVENAGRASKLPGFYFPRSVARADLVVSLPKLKTHHWIGMTASMKNLYGVIPGLVYGWPKNVLHRNGIPQTVFDINASLPKTIAIVDAIDCMEGDGPLLGPVKHMGLLVIGANATAVDATLARLIGLNPSAIGYLRLAGERLGPIDESSIEQRGEAWRPLRSDFALMDQPYLQAMRAGGAS